MATTIVSTTRTTQVTLASGDELLVSRSGAILFAGEAIRASGTGSNIDILINGEVVGLSSLSAVAVTMTAAGNGSQTGLGGHHVTISSSGIVQSMAGNGVRVFGTGNIVTNDGAINSGSTGVEATGNTAIVRNTGTITSMNAPGIAIFGNDGIVHNAGRIAGVTGIATFGDRNEVVNSGEIIGELFGIAGEALSLLNTGEITAGERGLVATGQWQIANSGAINALKLAAIQLQNGGTLSNTGLVQGNTAGVESTSSATVTLTNMGSILGNGVAVSLFSGKVVNGGTLASGGEGVLGIGTAGGAITVQNGGTITAGTNGIHMNGVTTATLRNDGRIEAGDAGVLIRNAAALPQIAVRSTGEIVADTGIEVESNGARVTNAGRIEAATGGIFVTGNDAVLRNAGTITADADFGIFLRGDELLQVINTGSITATGDGITVDQTSPKFAPAFVKNTGTIESGQVGVHSVGLDTGITLRNTGLIEGDFRGVAAQNGASGIVNIGTIAAGPESGTDRGAAVFLGTAADTLHNGGTILGRVDMGAGADRVSNAGWIDGEVRLGDGNDSYQAHRSGVAAHVLGGAGNDTLRGATGADRLSGEAGADVLAGGAGDDTLSGGFGRDILTGGAGADLFVFAARFDSPSGAGRDAITDFTPGQDRIDVSPFMAGAVYLGSAAFSGTGRALRFDTASGLLEGDSNSDGLADWQVQLTSGLTLSVTDFVL
jgi:Ca2+-binding RTX toxin-like protein